MPIDHLFLLDRTTDSIKVVSNKKNFTFKPSFRIFCLLESGFDFIKLLVRICNLKWLLRR